MDPDALLRHSGFVRAIARGLLAPDDAEDVVQDAMVAAFARPPRDPSRLRAWLGAVARRLSLQKLRGRRRRDARERLAARPEALPSAAEVSGQLEVQRRVVEAVVALEEPYRSTIVHRYFHERSVEEIAKGLGVPSKTVESRLTRALAQLRARLDREHGGRRAWALALVPLAWPRRVLLVTAKAKLAAAAVLLAVGGLGVAGVIGSRSGDESAQPRGGTRASVETVPLVGVPAPGAEPAAAAKPAATVVEPMPPLPPAPLGGIIGRITCADGRPAPGALVKARCSDNAAQVVAEFETRADEHGVYRFDGLPAGWYQVGATYKGHAPPEEHGVGYGLDPRHGLVISIQLKVGGTLTVVVRDIAGQPVQDAEAEVLRGIVIHEGQQPIARAITDERGVATIEHLPGGESVRVRAAGEEQLRTCLPVYDRSTAVVEFTVGAVVTGFVSLEDGTAVRDANVYFFGPMDGKSSATRIEGRIDGSGRYALRWLVPGSYEAAVQAVGLASGYRRIQVGPEPTGTIPLQLGRSIVSGRVTSEGKGEVYARLDSGNGETLLVTRVSADGGFAFHDVRPGKYKLSANESSDLDASVDVVVGRDERIEGKDLVLKRSLGEIEIEIVDAGGAFSGHVQLYLDDTSIAPPALGPGRYRFQARTGRRAVTVQWAGGSRSTKVDVEVEEGKTAYKTVRLGE